MGAPKATEIPAAAAAENTSRFLAVLMLVYLGKQRGNKPDLHCHLRYQIAS